MTQREFIIRGAAAIIAATLVAYAVWSAVGNRAAIFAYFAAFVWQMGPAIARRYATITPPFPTNRWV